MNCLQTRILTELIDHLSRNIGVGPDVKFQLDSASALEADLGEEKRSQLNILEVFCHGLIQHYREYSIDLKSMIDMYEAHQCAPRLEAAFDELIQSSEDIEVDCAALFSMDMIHDRGARLSLQLSFLFSFSSYLNILACRQDQTPEEQAHLRKLIKIFDTAVSVFRSQTTQEDFACNVLHSESDLYYDMLNVTVLLIQPNWTDLSKQIENALNNYKQDWIGYVVLYCRLIQHVLYDQSIDESRIKPYLKCLQQAFQNSTRKRWDTLGSYLKHTANHPQSDAVNKLKQLTRLGLDFNCGETGLVKGQIPLYAAIGFGCDQKVIDYLKTQTKPLHEQVDNNGCIPINLADDFKSEYDIAVLRYLYDHNRKIFMHYRSDILLHLLQSVSHMIHGQIELVGEHEVLSLPTCVEGSRYASSIEFLKVILQDSELADMSDPLKRNVLDMMSILNPSHYMCIFNSGENCAWDEDGVITRIAKDLYYEKDELSPCVLNKLVTNYAEMMTKSIENNSTFFKEVFDILKPYSPVFQRVEEQYNNQNNIQRRDGLFRDASHGRCDTLGEKLNNPL